MANQLGSNPWVLDTPGGGVLYAINMQGVELEWEGYAAGATITVADRNGKVIWAATAKSDLSLVQSFTIHQIYGFNLLTMTSGVLRVYYK